MTPRQGGGEKAWKLPAPVHGKSSPPLHSSVVIQREGMGSRMPHSKGWVEKEAATKASKRNRWEGKLPSHGMSSETFA